jgi:hypothetical protein
MVTKANYILLGDLRDIDGLNDDVEEFVHNNDHNNGWAYTWYIYDPKLNHEYSYNAINDYFISLGLEIGDTVIIHSKW